MEQRPLSSELRDVERRAACLTAVSSKDADAQSGAGLLVILQVLIVPHPGDTEMAEEDLGVISMLFIAYWKVCLQP